MKQALEDLTGIISNLDQSTFPTFVVRNSSSSCSHTSFHGIFSLDSANRFLRSPACWMLSRRFRSLSLGESTSVCSQFYARSMETPACQFSRRSMPPFSGYSKSTLLPYFNGICNIRQEGDGTIHEICSEALALIAKSVPASRADSIEGGLLLSLYILPLFELLQEKVRTPIPSDILFTYLHRTRTPKQERVDASRKSSSHVPSHYDRPSRTSSLAS